MSECQDPAEPPFIAFVPLWKQARRSCQSAQGRSPGEPGDVQISRTARYFPPSSLLARTTHSLARWTKEQDGRCNVGPSIKHARSSRGLKQNQCQRAKKGKSLCEELMSQCRVLFWKKKKRGLELQGMNLRTTGGRSNFFCSTQQPFLGTACKPLAPTES